MGTVTQRKLVDGTVRYRAEIRINRKGSPTYKESKTFNSKKLATNWLALREAEIDENPEILQGREDVIDLTLNDAITKYLTEVGGEYGRTKNIHSNLFRSFQ